MATKNIGKITQIIGAVLDVKYAEGKLPEINEAIKITRKDGSELVVEVAQHLGDDVVRCIAMGPTDGLVRGMDAVATGAAISVHRHRSAVLHLGLPHYERRGDRYPPAPSEGGVLRRGERTGLCPSPHPQRRDRGQRMDGQQRARH